MTRDGNLASALEAVKDLDNPVIDIEAGTYSYDQWCDMNESSFPFGHGTLTIQAKDNGKVIISGGFQITDWTYDEQNPRIVKTTVPQEVTVTGKNAVDSWRFESFWVNNHETRRARVPSNWTLPTILNVSSKGSKPVTYTVTVPSETMTFLDDLSEEELQDVVIVLFHYETSTRAYIKSIDTELNTITFNVYSSDGDYMPEIEKGRTYFYLENFKNALTQPGEWFLDREGTIYYYLKEGETAENIEAYASHLKNLMYIYNVNSITFKNIEFRYLGGNMPSSGEGSLSFFSCSYSFISSRVNQIYQL